MPFVPRPQELPRVRRASEEKQKMHPKANPTLQQKSEKKARHLRRTHFCKAGGMIIFQDIGFGDGDCKNRDSWMDLNEDKWVVIQVEAQVEKESVKRRSCAVVVGKSFVALKES